MKKILSLLLIATSASFAQITNRIYTIGNSVTDGIDFQGFQAISLQSGNNHIYGRAMTPGSPLELLETNCVFSESPYGCAINALTNYTWDRVSLQPFDRGLARDKQSALYFFNLMPEANKSITQFYIFSRYPRIPVGRKGTAAPATITGTYITRAEYETVFLEGKEGNGSTANVTSNETKAYYENLMNSVNTDLPSTAKSFKIIPVGEVFLELNKSLMAHPISFTGQYSIGGGQRVDVNVPGNTVFDFYEDRVHISPEAKYILGLTFFATMYRQDPVGTSVPSQYGFIPQELVDTIQAVVRRVVFNHPFSGASMADLIEPSSVSISPKNLTLSFLNSSNLSFEVLPTNASNKRVVWSSSNTSVAIVDSKGKVTGVGQGVVTITATTYVANKTDFAIVTVSGLANFTSVTGVLKAWDFANRVASTTGFNATTIMQGLSTTNGITNAFIADGMRPRFDGFGQGGLIASRQDSKTIEGSIGANEYFSFSIKPNDGKLVNINSIRFANKSENSAHRFFITSNIAGFTPSQVIATVAGGFNVINTITITGHRNLFQDVEFRIYPVGNSSSGSGSGVGIGVVSGNDFEFRGDVITPVDIEAPSSVPGLTYSDISNNGFRVVWNEATDNMIVKGYNIYLNGNKQNTTLLSDLSYSFNGLTSGTFYNISVAAVDFVGNESAVKSAIMVKTNAAPTAILSASTLTGAVPLTVNFSGTSSTDPDTDFGDFVLGYDWNFGNGETALSNSRTVVYSAPGVYSVSLSVSDTRGVSSSQVFANITVLSAPDATPPAVPVSLTGAWLSQTSALVTWKMAVLEPKLKYIVSLNGNEVATITGMLYTFVGLNHNSTNSYTVKAVDSLGNISSASNVYQLEYDNVAPAAPVSLSGFWLDKDHYILNWKNAVNEPKLSYKIYVNEVLHATSNTTQTTISGINNLFNNLVYVMAIDSMSNVSDASSVWEIPFIKLITNINKVDFGQTAASRQIMVTANVKWTVAPSFDWIQLNQTEGENNDTLVVSVDANEADTIRMAQLTISGFGVNRYINISQKSLLSNTSGDYSTETLAVFPNPSAGLYHFNIAVAFKIKDVMGNVVFKTEQKTNLVDISTQPSGIYYLETGQKLIKLVKL